MPMRSSRCLRTSPQAKCGFPHWKGHGAFPFGTPSGRGQYLCYVYNMAFILRAFCSFLAEVTVTAGSLFLDIDTLGTPRPQLVSIQSNSSHIILRWLTHASLSSNICHIAREDSNLSMRLKSVPRDNASVGNVLDRNLALGSAEFFG